MELIKFDGFAVALVFMALATSGCLNNTQDYDLSQLPVASVSGYAMDANGSAIVSMWNDDSHASLWRVNVHEGVVDLFLDIPGEDLTSPALSDDGKFLAFVSTKFGDGSRQERLHELQVMDLESGVISKVYAHHDWIYDVGVVSGGKTLYFLTTDEPTTRPWLSGYARAYVMRADAATGQAERLTKESYTQVDDLVVTSNRVLVAIDEPCQMAVDCVVRYGIHEVREDGIHKIQIPGVDVQDSSSPDRGAEHFCDARGPGRITTATSWSAIYDMNLQSHELQLVDELGERARFLCMLADGTVTGVLPANPYLGGARLVSWNASAEGHTTIFGANSLRI